MPRNPAPTVVAFSALPVEFDLNQTYRAHPTPLSLDSMREIMRTIRFARGLFAIASASLALWSLAYAETALQSVPSWLGWREAWVYATALVVLAASAGLCFPRTALPSLVTIGAYEGLSAAISLPDFMSKPLTVGDWYPFFEALTPFSAAWVLYAILRRQSQKSPSLVAGERAVRAAQALFGLTCVFYGWSHFAYADYTASMVPAWLPGHLALAYFTGLGHCAAGLALIAGLLPRLAATLEATMMSLFGLLVWVPSFFTQPRPQWATPPENQWLELATNLVLAASAWVIAIFLGNRPWTLRPTARQQ
jgi:uncharacterized membrane protein YphA (DoxX/SURF4 family)